MQQTLTEVAKQELFRSWVLDYSDMLYSHSVVRGLDGDEAKDVVQDTFLSAWRAMDSFEGKASAKNWLFVILKNKIADHYRKSSMRNSVHIDESDRHFDDSGHWARSAFPREFVVDPNSTDEEEFHRIFESCCSKLSNTQKAVFTMKYLDDMDSNDVCAHLSITANNYWTILHRAKVQLRACLEKNWFLIKKV